MPAKLEILNRQRLWAEKTGLLPDSRGYLDSVEANLFAPLSSAARNAFANGSGSELLDALGRPAKMKALHSSSALAVNFFDYWKDRDITQLLNALKLEPADATFDFEVQFPTGLQGTPPNLDLAFRFKQGLVVGVESKFTEWLTPKSPGKEIFKPKYFPEGRGLWSEKGLVAAQRLAGAVHRNEEQFRYLDAGQLLKHMLGIANNVQLGKRALYYLFYDCPGAESADHRNEIERFRDFLSPDMPFFASSYQDVFRHLERAVFSKHGHYCQYLLQRYFPNSI